MYSAMMLICFFLLPLCVQGFGFNSIPYIPCSRGKILSVSMSPCLNVPHPFGEDVACLIMHGTKVTIEVRFIAPFNAMDLTTDFSATFMYYTIPTPENNRNACFNFVMCPVVKREPHKLIYDFEVLKYYPWGKMVLDISVLDDRRKVPLVCVSIEVFVTKNNELSYD